MSGFRKRMSTGVFRDPHPSGKSHRLKSVDKHTGNSSLTKQTSHHQPQTTQSENTPSSLSTLIRHQPQLTAVFTPSRSRWLGRSYWLGFILETCGNQASKITRQPVTLAFPYYHNKHLQQEIAVQPQVFFWWRFISTASSFWNMTFLHSWVWLLQTRCTVIAPGNHINMPDKLFGLH